MTKILSIASLKGGVVKSITSVNMAYDLSALHDKRVLLIDNDRQGSASQFFNLYDPDATSLSHILREDSEKGWPLPIREVIRKTQYPNLDLIPANMSLLKAEQEILMDSARFQHLILRDALEPIHVYRFASVQAILRASDIVQLKFFFIRWALDMMLERLYMVGLLIRLCWFCIAFPTSAQLIDQARRQI